MKRVVRKIKSISQAIPEKGIWFDYYGDTFISVIPKEKMNHIRRKSRTNDSKKDNGTSLWHLRWQYERIEEHYGIPVSGERTYEKCIEVNGEKHYIDSLVDSKIAIEFQHTLSVSIDEMDSRYLAHEQFGYIPYLVIDLTHYTIREYKENRYLFWGKLSKWKDSLYGRNEMLFIDLEDAIIRPSKEVSSFRVVYTTQKFVKNILGLEKEFLEKKKITVLKRQSKSAVKELIQIESPEYEYFRRCFKNSTIKPFVLPIAKDLFQYWDDSEEPEDGLYEKVHSYSSRDRDYRIHYVNVMKIKYVEEYKYRKLRFRKSFDFLFSYVELNGVVNGSKVDEKFEIRGGKTIQIQK